MARKKTASKKNAPSKKWVIVVVSLIAIICLGFTALFFLPATRFEEKSRMVTIYKDQTQKSAVLAAFEEAGILRFNSLLGIAGAPFNIWDKMKPGRYEIKKGQSIVDIVRMLKNGRLAEVKLVINRVRTKSELARLISKQFFTDSLEVIQFLQSADSLGTLGLDTTLLFTKIIPDTYHFYADATMPVILQKLQAAATKFWLKNNRLQKAESLGLSPEQVYILASIVDEETNYTEDKYKIASVYINRLAKQMPLQACPTIKYAMNDFTITRIYEKYLNNPSPYNTYRVKGLPPGPICLPSPKVVDAVLNRADVDYIYMCAKPDYSGRHNFAVSGAEHMRNADAFQSWLAAELRKKK